MITEIPTVVAALVAVSVLAFTLLLLLLVYFRIKFPKPSKRDGNAPLVVGFFHPYCASGGGGERVLWKTIEVLAAAAEAELERPLRIVIYTIDEFRKDYKADLLRHVQSRFSIEIPATLDLDFVHLNKHVHYLNKSNRFSMMAESLGSAALAYRGLEQVTPHVFFDTTGCAFTFFVARLLAGCTVVAYVHYPTISTDMLQLVWERRPSYNNQVGGSRFMTYIKLVYYTVFAVLYGCVGSLASLVMVNSTWTYGHIARLWRGLPRSRLRVVFPPCYVSDLQTLSLAHREAAVLSIGQFRPEKDHALQLEAFALLLRRRPRQYQDDVQLVLVGSCRGPGDQQRVEELRKRAVELGLTDKQVRFVLNQPYSVLKEWLGKASIGIHTMWNEHFGIGIVEMMAAGLLVVAHKSGGPRTDIVVVANPQPQERRTGFLASNATEYADALHEALSMSDAETMALRQRARVSSNRFSDEVFATRLWDALTNSNVLR